MNILLFNKDETCHALEKRDPRAVHLLKVLRKKAGDNFRAGITGGKLGSGTILEIKKDGSLVFSLKLDEEPPPKIPIHIGLGFNRPIQMRRIFRELSNLGAAKISVFATDLGEKSYEKSKLMEDGSAFNALLEGAVQARDTILPELHIYKNAGEWLSSRAPERGAFLAAMDNVEPDFSFSEIKDEREAFVIAIGSERGWSARERILFREHSFTLLSLGERPLKSETAVTAAFAAAIMKLRRKQFTGMSLDT